MNKDSIDFKALLESLIRQRVFVATGISVGAFISLFLIAIKPNIFKAESSLLMQENSTETSIDSRLGSLVNTAGLGSSMMLPGNSGSNNTTLSVLKSPGVLKGVFEDAKKDFPESEIVKMSFKGWVNSAVSLSIPKESNILEVSYISKDKGELIPISNMLLNAFQEYSKRRSTIALDNAIDYTNDQLLIYKEQSKISSQKASDFGYIHALSGRDGMPRSGSISRSTPTFDQLIGGVVVGAFNQSEPAGLEARRELLVNKLRAVNTSLSDALNSEPSVLFLKSKSLLSNDTLRDNDVINRIDRLNALLAEKKSRLKASDQTIKTIERQLSALYNLNAQTYIADLRSLKYSIELELKSIDRPKEIVSKHKELTQKSVRDEDTVVALEDQLQQLKLQKAKNILPWEIVNPPDILSIPVAPKKLQILVLGLLGGFVSGAGVALAVDRRTGLVYRPEEIKDILDIPVISTLDINHLSTIDDFIKVLVDGPLESHQCIGLIIAGNIRNQLRDSFINRLSKELGNQKTLIIEPNSLRASSQASIQIICAAAGHVTFNQLNSINDQLMLSDIKALGTIIFKIEA